MTDPQYRKHNKHIPWFSHIKSDMLNSLITLYDLSSFEKFNYDTGIQQNQKWSFNIKDALHMWASFNIVNSTDVQLVDKFSNTIFLQLLNSNYSTLQCKFSLDLKLHSQWNPHLRVLWGSVDLNPNLRKI